MLKLLKMKEVSAGCRYPALFDDKHMITDWVKELSDEGRTVHTCKGYLHKEAFYRKGALWQVSYSSISNWLSLIPLDGRNGEKELIEIILHPSRGSGIIVTQENADIGHIFKFWLNAEEER